MEENGVQYLGFVIYPKSLQNRDDLSWSIGVHIMRGAAIKPFYVGNTAPTEEEAIARSLVLGRKVIDGEVPGFSVDDL